MTGCSVVQKKMKELAPCKHERGDALSVNGVDIRSMTAQVLQDGQCRFFHFAQIGRGTVFAYARIVSFEEVIQGSVTILVRYREGSTAFQ